MELNKRFLLEEILTRLGLLFSFLILEVSRPRIRLIWKEEWWMYKNNRMDSYVTPHMLWLILIAVSIILTSISTLLRKSNRHFLATMLGYSLALLVTGIITNIIKLSVGRPRPDFFYRCFPDGFERPQCSGVDKDVMNGRKSFPSGHSSLCWCALSYLSFYLLANMRIFSAPSTNNNQPECHVTVMRRRSICRLGLALSPCCLAFLIAISRVVDHHHHIEDVSIGSLLGLGFSYGCYRYYFPSLCSSMSQLCHEEHFQLLLSANSVKSEEQIV